MRWSPRSCDDRHAHSEHDYIEPTQNVWYSCPGVAVPDYDYDAPGWAYIAEEWRWLGGGSAPLRGKGSSDAE